MLKQTFVLIALIISAAVPGKVTAQNPKTTLEARITYFDEIITEKQYEGKSAGKGLALTFINNSDQDIFIPYFIPFIQKKNYQNRSANLFVTYYKKDSLGYKELLKPEHKNVPGVFSNDIVGLNQLMSTFSAKNKAIYDKLKLDIKRSTNNEKLYALLDKLDTMPLFLKAHQEWEYYLPMPLSPYAALGNYKITFEPTLTMPVKDKFPDTLMGYKKFYPAEIKCPPLYIHFELMRREESESIVEQIKKIYPDIKIKDQ